MYESKVFVTMVLILIFGEVLGLYGYVLKVVLYTGSYAQAFLRLIVALIMNSAATEAGVCTY